MFMEVPLGSSGVSLLHQAVEYRKSGWL